MQDTFTIPSLLELSAYLNSDLSQKIVVGLLTTFFGVFLGYLLGEKKRKEESYILSYKTNVESALEFKKTIEKNSEKIKILWEGEKRFEDIYILSCKLENIGGKIIKEESVLFEFSAPCLEIINVFFDPPLQRDIGLQELHTLKEEDFLKPNQKRYLIKNLLIRQKIGFNFILGINSTENKQDKEPIIFISNDKKSKVELTPISFVTSNSKEQVRKFVFLIFLFVTSPSIYYLIPTLGYYLLRDLRELLISITRIIILVSMIPVLNPFLNIVSEIVINLAIDKSDESISSQNSKYINIEEVRGDYIEHLDTLQQTFETQNSKNKEQA